MNGPRRLTLQLTPLLDLLLIVIFAQYLDVEHAQSVRAEQADQVIEERESAQERLARLRQAYEEVQDELLDATERASQAEQAQSERLRRIELLEQELDRTLDQQRLLGQLVVELFQIPREALAEVLDPAAHPAGARTEADLDRLRQRFREFQQQRSGRVIEHILSYDEIRKRCDVWDLHVDANNVLSLTALEKTLRLRIPVDAEGEVQQDRLQAELFNLYKSMPQPKSLVVVLLTYDRASRIYMVEAVRNTLAPLVAQMQADSAGRTRFEYADLGFRIE